jgi:hypothetical protein
LTRGGLERRCHDEELTGSVMVYRERKGKKRVAARGGKRMRRLGFDAAP